MAYAGRKRTRAGPLMVWGAKRQRTAGRFKSRSSRVGRRRRISSISANGARGKPIGFKNKRMNRRTYQNKLRDSTMFKDHYRSVYALSTSRNAPVGTELMVAFSFPCVANDFWLNSSGSNVPPSATITGDIVMRGGRSSMRLTNPNVNNMVIKVWLIKTTDGGGPPVAAAANFPFAWDPTYVDDFESNYRVLSGTEHILESNGSVDFERFWGLQKIDLTQFNAQDKRYYWVVGASQTASSAVGPVNIVQSHNISFVADLQ